MAFTDDQLRNLKLLLEVQSDAFKSNIQMILDEFKDLKKSSEHEISDLKKSLEFYQGKVDVLEEKVEKLELQLKKSNEETICMKELKKQINKQEDYSRKNNIRIDGVKELPQENHEQTQQKIESIIKNDLKLENCKIEIAHRIQVSKNPSSVPRTIIARLYNVSDRNEILRNSWKLKKTGIWINEDLCEATVSARKQQLPDLKAAKNAGKIAYFVRDRLIVKERSSLKRQTTPPPPPRRLENVFSPHALKLSSDNRAVTPDRVKEQAIPSASADISVKPKTRARKDK